MKTMKTMMMICVMLCGCVYGGDDAAPGEEFDNVERTLTVDCDLQSVKDHCKQCGTGGTFDCCRSISAPDVCDVKCTEWIIDPRTGKSKCK